MYVNLDTSQADAASVIETFVSFVAKSKLMINSLVAYAPGQTPQANVDNITTDQQWSVIHVVLLDHPGAELEITLEFRGDPALVDGRPILDNYCCESVYLEHTGGLLEGYDAIWDCYVAFLSLPVPPGPGAPVHKGYPIRAATPGMSLRPQIMMPSDAFGSTPAGLSTLDHYGPMIYLRPDQLAALGGLSAVSEAFPACDVADLSHLSDSHGAAIRLLRDYSDIRESLLTRWRNFLAPVLLPRGDASQMVLSLGYLGTPLTELFAMGRHWTHRDKFMTQADEEQLEQVPVGEALEPGVVYEMRQMRVFPLGSQSVHGGVSLRYLSMFYWFPGREGLPIELNWGSNADAMPSTRGLVFMSPGDLSGRMAACSDLGPFVAWRRVIANRSGRATSRWRLSFWDEGEEVVEVEVDWRRRSKPTITSLESLARFNELVAELDLAEQILLEPDCWGSLAESRLDVERLFGLVHRRPTSQEVLDSMSYESALVIDALSAS